MSDAASAQASATAQPRAAYASEPERLVEAYADTILRLSYTYLGSTHDAEDLCQSVLLRLLESGRTFASPEHERAWVIRVTANLCKDQLRSAARRTSVPLDSAAEPASNEPSALSGMVLEERHAKLAQALAELPPSWREAIYLHYYEGYPISQISRLTDCTEAAVAAHLSRGRARLRDLLEGDAS